MGYDTGIITRFFKKINCCGSVEFFDKLCYTAYNNKTTGDTMKTESVKINGIEIEYFSFGTGKRPFIILPGVSARSVMLSEMTIRSAYRVFEDLYTVYVFDRRRNMPDPYPVRRMAADTAEVMRALGIRDADVFGASQGGMMAMCIAIDNPELVHKIALGSTAAYADEYVIGWTRRWVELAESGDITALTSELIDCLFSEKTIGRYKDFLIHMNDGITEDDLRRFIIQTQAIDGYNITDELDRIKCPAFVIGAEGDKLLSADYSRYIAEKLGCPLYLYGGDYGHCVFDEAPDYKQRLMNFFQPDEAL